MILVDTRLGTFVLPYVDLTHLVFHTADELWLEIGIQPEGRGHLMPANMLAEPIVYLKVNTAFVQDKYKAFKALREAGTIPDSVAVERSFEPLPYIQDSLSWKNFSENLQRYHKTNSCDFLNFQFVEEVFREQLEYHTMAEFNKVRAKEYITYPSFHTVYADVYLKKRPFIGNYTQIMVEKMKQTGRSNMLVVSGIPGSGKHKLGESLAKLLAAEGLPAVCFKSTGHISENLKFTTARFIQQVVQFREASVNA